MIIRRQVSGSLFPKRRFPKSGQRLLRKIEEFRFFMRDEGYNIEGGASSYAMDLYGRLSIGVQRRIFSAFSDYVELLKNLKKNKVDLEDSRRVTWAFLRKENLQPMSATFSAIESDDVVEIYNRDYVQIFRNLHFFNFYNSSIFDLLVLDWMTLTKRESGIEERLFLQMESSFRRLPQVAPFVDLKQHSVSLRFNRKAEAKEILPKIKSPLIGRARKTRRVEAVLVTSEYLSEKSAPLELAQDYAS